MKILNAWNTIRYSFYTPIYNSVIKILDQARCNALKMMDYQKSDHILILGCGTGRDLNFLPVGPTYYLADITPAMLSKAKYLAAKLGHQYKANICSGDDLPFSDQSFDKVLLCLIIAVIPAPKKCLQEVHRVLKTTGEVLIFDKFEKESQTFAISIFKKLLNIITSILFSSINRIIEPLIKKTGFEILLDQPLFMGTIFRGIKLKKQKEKENEKVLKYL